MKQILLYTVQQEEKIWLNSNEASIVIDFISKQCKENIHEECSGRWVGLGFEIICSCECKHNKNGLVLDQVGEPRANTNESIQSSSSEGTLQEND